MLKECVEALVNENKDMVSKNSKYVARITGDDEYGKKELDNFIDPSVHYPVIATTSKLLNTGVDVQTCKLIVMDSNIQSMTEFKQIIGRGTRVREDYEKYYFTIMDFRQVTNLFADPDFDGEPVQSEDYVGGEPLEPHVPKPQPMRVGPRKYFVDGVEVRVLHEEVQTFDQHGNPITQSLRDYTKQKANAKFKSLEDFLQIWNKANRKTAIIKELREQGILLDELHEAVGKEYDDYDLICHVAFDQKLVTRRERSDKVKNGNYFVKYGQKARAVIDALLDKYADAGIENIESMTVLKVNPFLQFGTLMEIVGFFGGKEEYKNALQEIENLLYG